MDIFILFVLVILIIVSVLIMAFAILTALSIFKTGGAMFATTHGSKIRSILETVTMNPGQIVYDLGCGDGRFLIAAVRKYRVRAIGYEINPWAYFISRLRVWLSRTNVSVHFKDFWRTDLSNADIVFCYLFPDVMEILKEKLSRELKNGAKIISCNFEIPGWKPEKIIAAQYSAHNDPIFIYARE